MVPPDVENEHRAMVDKLYELINAYDVDPARRAAYTKLLGEVRAFEELYDFPHWMREGY